MIFLCNSVLCSKILHPNLAPNVLEFYYFDRCQKKVRTNNYYQKLNLTFFFPRQYVLTSRYLESYAGKNEFGKFE